MTLHETGLMLALSRRQLLATLCAGLVACGCARLAQRQPNSEVAGSAPELDAWNTEARGMLSDALQALRTFDVFAAYRVSSALESSVRLQSMLAADPPTSAAWDEATHVTRGLHGRADQLFQAVTKTQIDPSLWREQRVLADATNDVLDLSEALLAYRERIDRLAPGDASGAVGLLDKAWGQWEAVAARFGLSRSEPIACSG